MNWQLLMLVLLAQMSVLAGMFAIFYGIPRYQTSRLRHELWAIRDDAWDALYLRGELVDIQDEVHELIAHIEERIRRAHELTASRAVWGYFVMKVSNPESLRELTPTLAFTIEDQKPALRDYYRRVRRAEVRHFKWGGSAGSWVAFRLSHVVFSFRMRRRARNARERAEAEIREIRERDARRRRRIQAFDELDERQIEQGLTLRMDELVVSLDRNSDESEPLAHFSG